MEILITKGTYNTKDYRVVKEYKKEKYALNFLKQIKYPHSELFNFSWTYNGNKYHLSIN
jgi:hypothetical protein